MIIIMKKFDAAPEMNEMNEMNERRLEPAVQGKNQDLPTACPAIRMMACTRREIVR